MCRNIKRLRRDSPPVAASEFEEAARHLVRKLSGFQTPSTANREVFEKAVADITRHTQQLFEKLTVKGVSGPCVET